MFDFKNMTPEDKATVIEHLEALRRALIVSITAVIIASIPAFYYSDYILEFIKQPLNMTHTQLNFTGVFTPFYVKITLSLIGGLIIAFPIVAWEIWRFVAPALYPNERRYVIILFPAIILLFVGGVLFGYLVIMPTALYFLVVVMGEGLTPIITVDDYVNKMLAFTVPFGLVFQLPIVVYFLTRLRIIKPEMLSKNRKYALLAIAILAAVLTPGPDPVSQCLLGLPIYLLFEISIIVSKLAQPKPKEDDSTDLMETSDREEGGA